MGGNGTASAIGYVSDKQYSKVGVYNDPVFGEIEIVSFNGKQDKNPEESNSPNRIYATFRQSGNDINEIAKYGPDHKKIWAIHVKDHNSKKLRKKGEAVIGPHIHLWADGKAQIPKPLAISDPRYSLINRLRTLQKQTSHVDK